MPFQIAPYGSWASPVTADLITSSQIHLAEPRFGPDGLYWLEGRPVEGGRVAIVRRTAEGVIEDAVATGVNVRSRVHEMGGGAYGLSAAGLIFSDDRTRQLFRQLPGARPIPVTPEASGSTEVRYAEPQATPGGAGVMAVRETHGPDGQVVNELVGMPADGSSPPVVLASGRDFYASPRVSPAGDRLMWLSWNHPQMPWDGTELRVADLAGWGSIGEGRLVAGGSEESVFQPEWSPGGGIYFVSDRTGWWNLYRERDGRAEPLHQKAAEFGAPQWVFGLTRYAFVDEFRIVCAYTEAGRDHLALLGIDGGELVEWPLPFTTIDAVASDGTGNVALIAASPADAAQLLAGRAGTPSPERVRGSLALDLDTDYVSIPEHIEFPASKNRTAYAYFYPPLNPEYEAGEGSRPPLIVTSHGGPTSAASSALNLTIQFWTSRGFAVVDVNYGGSTGYGREYRRRLDGEWGVVDVDDCVHAAEYLANAGRIDSARMAIRGKSASGLTTLSALVFHDLFSAGASYYGVADLEGLARDTHKFEAHYMDRLIGPLPATIARYRERSPIRHAHRLSTPVILFQGLEDRIVPPAQAEVLIRSLEDNHLPYACLRFPEEGHGFRRASTIRRALEAELYFYSKVFGFDTADDIEPVEIANWEPPDI